MINYLDFKVRNNIIYIYIKILLASRFVQGSVSVPLPITDLEPDLLPEPEPVAEADSLVVSRLLVVAKESLLDSVIAFLKRQATEGNAYYKTKLLKNIFIIFLN